MAEKQGTKRQAAKGSHAGSICPVTYIYVLFDPRSGAVRYVGKSVDPWKRYAAHTARCRRATAVARWSAELRSYALRPEMQIIEACGEDWELREQAVIAEYRRYGADLLNIESGGRGEGWSRWHRREPVPYERVFRKVIARYTSLARELREAGSSEAAQRFVCYADFFDEWRRQEQRKGRECLARFYRHMNEQFGAAVA